MEERMDVEMDVGCRRPDSGMTRGWTDGVRLRTCGRHRLVSFRRFVVVVVVICGGEWCGSSPSAVRSTSDDVHRTATVWVH